MVKAHHLILLICITFLLFIFYTAFKHSHKEFIIFKNQFNKSYRNPKEYIFRHGIFQKSLQSIQLLNSKRKFNSSALFGLTHLSDLAPIEYVDQQMYENVLKFNNYLQSKNMKHKIISREKLPTKVDWREKGAVTEVKNQKQCGACWAFSITENMETMNFLKTKQLLVLSPQQLIDCAGYGNLGCYGGDTCQLMQWVKDKKVKVVQEEVYPLRLENQECKKFENTTGVGISQFTCENMVGREDTILSMLAMEGPVTVAINALTWQNYLEGVIHFHCSDSLEYLNHAVQIVGYDLTAEVPHYIVRNSWGKHFGDKGYLYIGIGENMCGLGYEVSSLNV